MAERRNSDGHREQVSFFRGDLSEKAAARRNSSADKEDIITVSGVLTGVEELDTPPNATVPYTKYLQEKSWYVDLIPGDSDITEVTIWFIDQENAQLITEDA